MNSSRSDVESGGGVQSSLYNGLHNGSTPGVVVELQRPLLREAPETFKTLREDEVSMAIQALNEGDMAKNFGCTLTDTPELRQNIMSAYWKFSEDYYRNLQIEEDLKAKVKRWKENNPKKGKALERTYSFAGPIDLLFGWFAGIVFYEFVYNDLFAMKGETNWPLMLSVGLVAVWCTLNNAVSDLIMVNPKDDVTDAVTIRYRLAKMDKGDRAIMLLIIATLFLSSMVMGLSDWEFFQSVLDHDTGYDWSNGLLWGLKIFLFAFSDVLAIAYYVGWTLDDMFNEAHDFLKYISWENISNSPKNMMLSGFVFLLANVISRSFASYAIGMRLLPYMFGDKSEVVPVLSLAAAVATVAVVLFSRSKKSFIHRHVYHGAFLNEAYKSFVQQNYSHQNSWKARGQVLRDAVTFGLFNEDLRSDWLRNIGMDVLVRSVTPAMIFFMLTERLTGDMGLSVAVLALVYLRRAYVELSVQNDLQSAKQFSELRDKLEEVAESKHEATSLVSSPVDKAPDTPGSVAEAQTADHDYVGEMWAWNRQYALRTVLYAGLQYAVMDALFPGSSNHLLMAMSLMLSLWVTDNEYFYVKGSIQKATKYMDNPDHSGPFYNVYHNYVLGGSNALFGKFRSIRESGCCPGPGEQPEHVSKTPSGYNPL